MVDWAKIKQQRVELSSVDIELMNILADLQAMRLKQGISQKAFAERIKMKTSQLARLERLDAMPALRTVERYAEGLGFKIKLTLVTR